MIYYTVDLRRMIMCSHERSREGFKKNHRDAVWHRQGATGTDAAEQ